MFKVDIRVLGSYWVHIGCASLTGVDQTADWPAAVCGQKLTQQTGSTSDHRSIWGGEFYLQLQNYSNFIEHPISFNSFKLDCLYLIKACKHFNGPLWSSLHFNLTTGSSEKYPLKDQTTLLLML